MLAQIAVKGGETDMRRALSALSLVLALAGCASPQEQAQAQREKAVEAVFGGRFDDPYAQQCAGIAELLLESAGRQSGVRIQVTAADTIKRAADEVVVQGIILGSAPGYYSSRLPMRCVLDPRGNGDPPNWHTLTAFEWNHRAIPAEALAAINEEGMKLAQDAKAPR